MNYLGVIMANIKSQIKRNRQNEKRRQRNRVYRGSARTYIKKFDVAFESNDIETARVQAANVVQALDKAAQKGVIHRNNAARRKSSVMSRLNQLEGAQS